MIHTASTTHEWLGRSRLRRLSARLHSGRLDHDLAAGSDPSADPLLACRAEMLRTSAQRDRLAAGIEDVIDRAHRPPAVGSVAPIARASVRANTQLLNELAERLRVDGPIGVRGVAATRLLLTDGASPLWAIGDARELSDAVEAALIDCGTVTRWT